MDQESMRSKQCRCPHHSMVPLMIVLLGLVFLLGALGTIPSSTVAVLWPVVLILIGLQKMFQRYCKCC